CSTGTTLPASLYGRGRSRPLLSFPTRRSSDLGGLPLFRERYNMIDNPVYALSDVQSGNLTPYEFKEWEPEKVETYEVGYKSAIRSEEHTSELQSRENLVCRLLLEKKNTHHRRT